jgi:hypothetical protein
MGQMDRKTLLADRFEEHRTRLIGGRVACYVRRSV